MLELLQKFSVGNMTGVLVTVLVLWAIWPVICGVLGASRGGVGTGVMHGLMWGPIGLPIVLLSSKKHTCPMCGKRTLREPVEGVAGFPPGEHAMGPPPVYARPCPAVDTVVEGVSIEVREVSEDLTGADLERAADVVEAACAGYSDAEAARLRAWLNGEKIVK